MWVPVVQPTILEAILQQKQTRGRSHNPTILEVILLQQKQTRGKGRNRSRTADDVPPMSKAELARFMADLFEHQGANLPNFDEFIYALARPRWKWTTKADKIFRRINRVRNPAPTVQEIIMQLTQAGGKYKRPATRRQNNRVQPALAPATSESSVQCTEESVDISSDAPVACTPSSGGG